MSADGLTTNGTSSAASLTGQSSDANVTPHQGPAMAPQAGSAGTTSPRAGQVDATTPSSQATSTDTDDLDADTLRRLLSESRKEAAENRRKAKELDTLRRELEDAKLSETERLQKQYAEAQAEIAALRQAQQETAIRAEVRALSASLGVKPELALKLIDQSAIVLDDQGAPSNIHELLTQALEAFDLAPLLGRATTTPAAPVAPAAPSGAQMGATNPPRSASAHAASLDYDINKWPRLNDIYRNKPL